MGDGKSLKCKKDNLTSRRKLRMSSSLKTTIEKIKALEIEKKNLLNEIDGLRKIADAKALALESEVGLLRNEVKSLKVLVNGTEPNSTPNKIQI
jgi:hypothetical protein